MVPLNAAGKGKIERLNRDVDHFSQECNLMKCGSLEEINAYFITWLDVYDSLELPRKITKIPQKDRINPGALN